MLFLFILSPYDFLSLAKLESPQHLLTGLLWAIPFSFCWQSFVVPLTPTQAYHFAQRIAMELSVRERNSQSQVICAHIDLWYRVRTRLLHYYMNRCLLKEQEEDLS